MVCCEPDHARRHDAIRSRPWQRQVDELVFFVTRPGSPYGKIAAVIGFEDDDPPVFPRTESELLDTIGADASLDVLWRTCSWPCYLSTRDNADLSRPHRSCKSSMLESALQVPGSPMRLRSPRGLVALDLCCAASQLHPAADACEEQLIPPRAAI